MAGMLNSAIAGKLNEQPVEEPNLDGDEDPNVTPEEQKAYEDFVADGLLLIYEGGQVRSGILELLDEDPSDLKQILGEQEDWDRPYVDPARYESGGDLEGEEVDTRTRWEAEWPMIALAATAVIVVLELVRRAGENRPDDAIIMHGGKEILEDLANLAEEARIHEYSPEELNKAWLMGMDLWREAAAAEGLIDTEQLKAEFAVIKEADARGEFGGDAPERVMP